MARKAGGRRSFRMQAINHPNDTLSNVNCFSYSWKAAYMYALNISQKTTIIFAGDDSIYFFNIEGTDVVFSKIDQKIDYICDEKCFLITLESNVILLVNIRANLIYQLSFDEINKKFVFKKITLQNNVSIEKQLGFKDLCS